MARSNLSSSHYNREKPISVDTFAEGEEVITATNDEANETWLRDKYKGMKFVDKDMGPEEHRAALYLNQVGAGSPHRAPRAAGAARLVHRLRHGRRQAPRH